MKDRRDMKLTGRMELLATKIDSLWSCLWSCQHTVSMCCY